MPRISNSSRGRAVSGYIPAFGGPSGAQIYAEDMRGVQITGTIISAGITYAVAHGLGEIPSIVVVGLRSTMALISAGGADIGESAASARTATNIYLTAEQHGIGFAAYVQI